MNQARLRRLEAVEERADRLAPAAPAHSNVAAWLQTLSADQLDRLEALSWAWSDRTPISAEVLLAVAGER